MTVSFCNIEVKEKAEDTKEDVKNNWMGAHDVGNVAGVPNTRNEVEYDRVGIKGSTVEEIQEWSLFGVRSVWLCGWYTYSRGVHRHKISGNNYEQVFVVTEDGLRPPPPTLGRMKEIKASIHKFDRTVTRSTAGSASHQDS